MRESDPVETGIRIKLIPRSSRNEILGEENGVYRVKITEPPVEGRANKALIRLFSEKLGVPKGHVELVSGKTSRLKMIRIRGLSPANIALRLR